MAKNRLNSIGFECLDVFPSLVKVPGYEDVVLDDVWRTTIAFDNSYSGDCTDLVRPEHWENYEVVKKMTIDEKIEFWQEVMEYARSRGVDVYFLFGHIYTFAEQGKYGITNDIENPVTKDYYYKSAKAMLETYPLIKGFGLSPGENMGWDKAPEAYAKNVWWMHDVYVPAINEVLEKDENRSFDIFLHTQASENFGSIFSDCKANINFRIGLAGTHMYASSKPPVYELNASLENLPKGSKLLLTFRNEDCFDLRWGDAEFVREFIATIPNREEIFGFITGSDGYSYARDYSSTDKDLQGQLYMQKHYLNFMLFGRLAYDNSLSDEALYQIFDNHFDGQKGTRELYDTTAIASKIIPLVNKIYFQDNGDYTWFVQGNWSHPNTFGFIDIKRWMRSNNVYFDSNAMSIEDYALSVAASESLSTELVIPPEIARELRTYSETVLANIEALKTTVKKSKKLSLTEKNFWALVDDDIAMAYLGLFYSERILGAVNIRVFNETNNEDFKTEAVANLQRSYEAFEKYATIMSTNYVAQQFSRVGSYDVLANLELVKKDIEIAKTWKPRPLPKTTNAPSKAMFFKDSN